MLDAMPQRLQRRQTLSKESVTIDHAHMSTPCRWGGYTPASERRVHSNGGRTEHLTTALESRAGQPDRKALVLRPDSTMKTVS